MATELKEFTQEEALKKKVRQKRRIRGCLIVLNALLLCYFSYLMVDTIVERVVEKKQEINNEIIQLNGKSSSKSKEIYEKYISSSIDVNDFATYGKYFLSSSPLYKTQRSLPEQKNSSIEAISGITFSDISVPP